MTDTTWPVSQRRRRLPRPARGAPLGWNVYSYTGPGAVPFAFVPYGDGPSEARTAGEAMTAALTASTVWRDQ